jgi:excisionase family DNA binding protein
MPQKLLTVDEAAARLGISTDELLKLVDQRKIFAIKDGISFRFKEEEISRYEADAGSSSGAFYLPVDESQDDDIGLVSDDVLGSSGAKSSTVIGPKGGSGPSDSDLKLSDSDVKLVAEGGSSSSGVKLVPGDSSGKLGGSSGKLGSGSSGKLGSGTGSGTGSGAGGETVEIKRGSSGKLGGGSGTLGGGSDLTISESGLALGADDEIEIGSSVKGKGIPGPGSSKVRLADDKFDDDDIVLGGSSSGIGDSGINLKPADSGLNLEEPLELGGDDGVSESSSSDSSELSSDDDFLLTPMLELDEQESDSSGSQVIALDTEGESFDDQAATLLGSEPGAAGFGSAASSQMESPMMMVPAVTQAPYPAWVISGLVVSFMILSLTGMMMFEMIRDIWSWDGPTEASTTIMDGILGLFEDTK